MTPESLETLVLDSDGALQFAHAFDGFDDKARAKLSTTAQKLYRQLHQSKADKNASPRLAAVIAARKGESWNFWNSPQTRNALLALFAVAPLSALKKRDVFFWQEHIPAIDTILRDRRPEWIDDWIEHSLDGDIVRLDFPTLRAWIRDGICRKPEVDGYYRMFAGYLMRTDFHKREAAPIPPISAQLLADPDLLADIDGLFRVENIAFNTNSWLTAGASAEYESWTEALIKVSAAGHVDREHFLTLALEGLTLDLKQNQLSGFHGFYRKMEPTPGEQLRHQQRYIDLLCHPVGHVAKFAIEMLGALEKKAALDTEPVLRELQGLTSSGGKGNAGAALKLIGRVLARTPDRTREALDAVGEALRHADADVQALALGILEKYAAKLDDAQRDILSGAAPFVAASNQQRLNALLGAGATAAPPAPAKEMPDAIPAYQPISDDPNANTVLPFTAPIEPIATVDALIEAVLHALEIVDSPDEVERIVDAISRLADQRPFDFAARTAPLLHRLKTGRGSSNGLMIGNVGVGLALLDLLYTWLTGTLYRTESKPAPYLTREDAFVPVIAHLRVVTARVAQRSSQPLLCAPTHKGGWIDPLVWLERLQALQALQAPGILQSMDFRLSLLRLAPDNRTTALGQLTGLSEPLRRIANFALGGTESVRREDRTIHAAWITAARARAPQADWAKAFAPLDLDDTLPDALRPARYVWSSSHRPGQFQNTRWKTPELTISVTCAGDDGAPPPAVGLFGRIQQVLGQRITTRWEELPSAAFNRQSHGKYYWSGELNALWAAQWLALIWPQNPAASHIKGVTRLAMRMDENSSSWTPSAGYFPALFQPARPWGEPGHLLLCLGLVGKDADARGLSVDALIEGIETHLFDPALFASTMAGLARGEWIKLNRLGEALMLAVPASPLHAAVVNDALQRLLPQLDLQQKNLFHLLEVLLETQAMTRLPLSDTAKSALDTFRGSGKAAKIARELLAKP